MYSGFRLMNIGQDWNIKSTVLALPSLDISLRNASGGYCIRLSAGTYEAVRIRSTASCTMVASGLVSAYSELQTTKSLSDTSFHDIRILASESVRHTLGPGTYISIKSERGDIC